MFPISKINLLRLVFTLLALLAYLVASIVYPNELITIFTLSFFGVKLYHIAWLIVVLNLSKSLLFIPKNKMASGKIFAEHYKSVKNFSKNKLKKEIKKYNSGAVKAGLFWLSVLGIFALVYFGLNLSKLVVYGFVIFISLLDIFYVSVWCPYRSWIVKNKCCNACRIYNWGLWMIFLPLLMIPNFWNYSIVGLSILVFIRWEYHHYKHPERFYAVSNANLICKKCKKADGFCSLNVF